MALARGGSYKSGEYGRGFQYGRGGDHREGHNGSSGNHGGFKRRGFQISIVTFLKFDIRL